MFVCCSILVNSKYIIYPTKAESLIETMKGRIKIEDAGFNWKLLGPDVLEYDYVVWQCDQDAYAAGGQKCSAQSLLVAHSNWLEAGLVENLKNLAEKRNLNDFTITPTLSHTTSEIKEHINDLLSLNGAKLLFGNEEILNTNVPKLYGMIKPTAIYVPLKTILSSPLAYNLVTTEIFGPLQVITKWDTDELSDVYELFERMNHHLTASIVSSDPVFCNTIAGNTVNGTTYIGKKSRTTGAPQNHWFGPSGDPLAAGIGSPEAILQTWTCHREIIYDIGPVKFNWSTPQPT